MKMRSSSALLFLGSLAIAGCSETANDKPVAQNKPAVSPAGNPAVKADAKIVDGKIADANDDAEILENLAKLSPEDRKLAEQQRFCAVNNDDRLGEMGTPVKIMLKDQPVFLCCGGCEKKARKDPDATLAKAKELKEKVAASSKK